MTGKDLCYLITDMHGYRCRYFYVFSPMGKLKVSIAF